MKALSDFWYLHNKPFRWDEARRTQIRAELDAQLRPGYSAKVWVEKGQKG